MELKQSLREKEEEIKEQDNEFKRMEISLKTKLNN